MLFHSQAFVLLFLPATVALYYALARHMEPREWALIAASLVFYAWWDVRFLPLLLGHILVTWGLARAFHATRRRAYLDLAAYNHHGLTSVYAAHLRFGFVRAGGGGEGSVLHPRKERVTLADKIANWRFAPDSRSVTVARC